MIIPAGRFIDMTIPFIRFRHKLESNRIHSVNARICVEGIEQREWCQKMKKMGADFLQGYFYGKPCKKSDFITNYVRGN